jgi:hypothetical protein
MHNSHGKGWKRPGMRSSDYGEATDNDHDRRIYASTVNYSGIGPRGYRRSDSNIHDEICKILYWDPDVDASEIEVKVSHGVVSLLGEVDSRHAKRMAEAVVENVRGVEDVLNRLKIKKNLDMNSDKTITRGDDGLFSQETIER